MNHKVALVTGSSSGIGLLTSVELAKAGFQVVATMRDPTRRASLDEAATAASAQGRIEVRRLDITEFDSIPGAVNDIVGDHGQVDVLVNNAGFLVDGFIEDVKLAELREQLDTNFFGHVAVTQAVLPHMRARNSGHVIMLSSILGRLAQPAAGCYSASKFALEGWTETARLELAPTGVKLVLVEPGAFKTDIWERNRVVCEGAPAAQSDARVRRFADTAKGRRREMGDPAEVARLVVKIAQDPEPRLRYRVGRDASTGYWLHRILPWSVWEKMILNRMRDS